MRNDPQQNSDTIYLTGRDVVGNNDWGAYYERRSLIDHELARDGVFSKSLLGALSGYSEKQMQAVFQGRRSWHGTTEWTAHLGEPIKIGSVGHIDSRRVGCILVGSVSGQRIVWSQSEEDTPMAWKNLEIQK